MNDHLQSERIIKHLQDAYGTEPEHLWAQYPTYSVFRHPLSRKWYAIIMDIPKSRLGLEGDEPVTVLNLKCSPLMVGSLLSEPGFFPAYHMNKTSWISVLLDGTVPDEKIVPLLELSYDTVSPKRKPRLREEITIIGGKPHE